MVSRRIDPKVIVRMIFDGYDYGKVKFLAGEKPISLWRGRIRYDPSECKQGAPVDVLMSVKYARYVGLM